MFNALQELSNAPGGKLLNNLSSSLCGFLLSCYKDDGNGYLYKVFHCNIPIYMHDICFSLVASCGSIFFLKYAGNEEAKLAILSALASWLARGADCSQPAIISFFSSGLKEKEGLRRGHLRCLRVICNNADVTIQVYYWLIAFSFCCYWPQLFFECYICCVHYCTGIIFAGTSYPDSENRLYQIGSTSG